MHNNKMRNFMASFLPTDWSRAYSSSHMQRQQFLISRNCLAGTKLTAFNKPCWVSRVFLLCTQSHACSNYRSQLRTCHTLLELGLLFRSQTALQEDCQVRSILQVCDMLFQYRSWNHGKKWVGLVISLQLSSAFLWSQAAHCLKGIISLRSHEVILTLLSCQSHLSRPTMNSWFQFQVQTPDWQSEWRSHPLCLTLCQQLSPCLASPECRCQLMWEAPCFLWAALSRIAHLVGWPLPIVSAGPGGLILILRQ